MDISSHSYYFIGLNQNRHISEGIKQLCLGEIKYSLEYFNSISNIASKSICKQLSVSRPPLQFIPSAQIPSTTNFNWTAEKFSQKFGEKNNGDELFIILYELNKLKNNSFIKLYKFLTEQTNKEEITPQIMLNLYKTNRNLFLALIPFYSLIFSKFDQNEVLSKIAKYDYNTLSLFSEDSAIIQLTIDVPAANLKDQYIIMQSVIESKNQSLGKNAQDLIASSMENEIKDLQLIHQSIAGHQHFDDIILQSLVTFITHSQYEKAKIYADSNSNHLVLAYILSFPHTSSNKKFLEDTINEIRKINSKDAFDLFLNGLKMDLEMVELVFKISGKRISFNDFVQHSFFYLTKEAFFSDTFSKFQDYSFLKQPISYSLENTNIDYTFIVCYSAFNCLLTDFNIDYLKECLAEIDDPLLLQWFLVDLFSLCFIRDKKTQRYIFTAQQILEILNLINNYTKFELLNNYVQQGLNKASCYGDSDLTVEMLFNSVDTLIHPLLFSHKYEDAKKIASLYPKYMKFIELVQCIEAQTQDLVYVPKITYRDNILMFNIELGLATSDLEYARKALQSMTSSYFEKPILERRISQSNPLSPVKQAPRKTTSVVKQIDDILRNKKMQLSKFHQVDEHEFKFVSSLIDFLNIYIEAGATTPEVLKGMEVNQTLDFLISKSQFDLAIEFAGVNHIDFFLFLFVKYRANESILKLISPRYPLASFTMAICSLSPEELSKFRDIILPENSSKQMINYFEMKISQNDAKQVISLADSIINNDKDKLDDILYREDINVIKKTVLEVQDKISLKLLSSYLEFIVCFDSNDQEIIDFYSKVSFFMTLNDPPQTIEEANNANRIESLLIDLINKEEYQKAKLLAQYTETMNRFIYHILQNITQKIRQGHNIKQLLESCKTHHYEMFKQISPKNYKTRYMFIKNSEELMRNPEVSEEYTTLSVYFFLPEDKRPIQASIQDIIQSLVTSNDIQEINRVAHNFTIDFSIFLKCIVNRAMEIINSYGDSHSLPILIPILPNLMVLLNEYHEFAQNCKGFGDSFIPICALLSVYISVDSIENEYCCAEALLFFRVFLKKLYKVSTDKGKQSIESILKPLKLVENLNSVAFFARFNYSYGSDLVTTDQRAEEIHKLLVENDYIELSNIFMPNSVLCDREHFFTLLKMHEYDFARDEFKQFADQIKRFDFKLQRDFIRRLMWALKSPLCLDEEWMSDPVVDISPMPMHISVQQFVQSKISAFYPSCNTECAFYLGAISENESGIMDFLISNGSIKAAFTILTQNRYDPALFIHGILIPSLSNGIVDKMIKMLLEIDPYLEESDNAIAEAVKWCKKMNIAHMRYKLDILTNDFEDAIDAVQDMFIKEDNIQRRTNIIKQCTKDIPSEVDAMSIIRFQEDFMKLQHEKGLKAPIDVHLFKEGQPKALALLFDYKYYKFAVQIITTLNINPSNTLDVMIPKINLSKSRKLVQGIEKEANQTVSQAWITVFLSKLNSNPKTESFVSTIIEKDVINPRVKCHLYLQFNKIEAAKKIAQKEKLTEFLDLLSF